MPVSPLRTVSLVLAAALTLALGGAAQAASHASAHASAAKCRAGHTRGRAHRCTKHHRVKRRARTLLTTAVTSFEAESMTRSSNKVRVVSDSTASGGQALLFMGNSSASATRTVPAASGLDLRARGDQCQGAPVATVTVDGHQVGSVPVSTTTWGSYKLATSIAPGSHNIAVAYGNDKYVRGTCDRNLRLDKVAVIPLVSDIPAPSPTQPVLSSPTPTPSPSGQLTIALAPGDPSRVVFGLPSGTAKVHIYEASSSTYPAPAGTYDYTDLSAATAASPWQPSRPYVDGIALDSSGKPIGTWYSSTSGGSRVQVTLSSSTPAPAPAPAPAPDPTPTTTTTPTPAPAPAPAPPPAPSGFTVGMVSGPAAAWEAGLTSAANLYPAVVRVPFDIGTSVSTVQGAIAGLAAKGEQALLLAEFPGRIPSTSEAQSLAGWAHAFGPGGTFWQGRSDGYLAVRYIEFGNETNMSYQFGGVSSGPSYITRAQNYALAATTAVSAIDSSSGNAGVGLLAIGDNGGCGCSQWVDGMFSAVPDLNQRIAGWTMHPYGPKTRYAPIINQAISDTAKHGDTTLPFFITEYGISTNDGVCLSSNYNWPTCLTYQQAADDLAGAVADMHQTYGSRLAALFIFEQRDMASNPTDREANFGAIKSDGSLKGAFTNEVRTLINTYRG